MFKFGRIELHRKEVYTLVSLVLGLFLLGALINDFVAILSAEMPEHSTQGFTVTVLMIHYITFAFAVLGFVYNSLAGESIGAFLGIVSIVLNMATFITRIILELVFLEFRPEELAHSA